VLVKRGLLGMVLLVATAATGVSYCHAQGKAPRNPDQDSPSVGKTNINQLQVVLGFVDRARGFSDLDNRVNTLVRIGGLLWQQKGEEDFARQLFLQLNDQLKLAASTQSKLDPNHNSSALIGQLRQSVLRYVARYDVKLARELLLEQAQDGDSRIASKSLELAIGLTMDGSVSAAQAFAEQSIDSDFSGLNIPTILGFLHQLRLRDSASADSLFIKVLSQIALQPNVSADNLLLIGNYLFINDVDVGVGYIRYTPVQIDSIYFSAGIGGQRSGLAPELVRTYLKTGLTILARQLLSAQDERPRKRYEAAAKLLELKAVTFAPELVAPLDSIARDFASSSVKSFANLENETDAKLVDYDTVAKELEKIPDSNTRDQRCLGLASTAYRQNDLDTASKLADLVNDVEKREHVRDLIRFRRAANYLAKDDVRSVEQAEQKIGLVELRIVLELGLATLELREGNPDAALSRLQTVTVSITTHDLEARPLYLLTVASLLAQVQPTLAVQALGEAFKALSNSSAEVAELSRRDALTKVKMGKRTAFFSVSSKEIPFVDLQGSLPQIYHQSPQDTIALALSLKNERVLGPALVVLANEILGTVPSLPKESKKASR
jgi:hypothetical protein